jgi:hypothetical protein
MESGDSDVTVKEGWSEVAGGDRLLEWAVPGTLPEGTYRWQVLATDDMSQSDWSELVTLVVHRAPLTPNLISASSGRYSVAARFIASPESIDPVIDYEVLVEPGAHTTTVPAGVWDNTAIVDGLVEGDYTVSVTARNEIGTSAPTTPRPFHVYPANSLAPTDLEVDAQGESVHLTWVAPEDSGDSPIIDFSVGPHPFVEYFPSQTVEGVEATIDDLTIGTYYLAIVRARTDLGFGDSAGIGFVPFGPPDAPRDVTVSLGDGSLDVRWTKPEFDGAAWIDSYTVTASPGGRTITVPGGFERQGVNFDGLENGTDYTFRVAAINAAGTGEASEPTSPRAPTSQGVDTDADGLPDVLEDRSGANPLIADSDGDGLLDVEEVLQLAAITSPISSDSDGDGISDFDEDSDEDGLTNGVDILALLDPAATDSDHDGILDLAESEGVTDPLVTDTDDDGIHDGFELDLGLNPLLTDSDSDGTPDAESAASRIVTAEGVSAAVVGAAGQLSQFAVEVGVGEPILGSVTASAIVVGLTPADGDEPGGAASAIQTASSITIHLADESAADRVDSLRPVRWNHEAGEWEFVDNDVSVSTADKTVTIFSPTIGVRYAVVDLDAWRAVSRSCDAAANGAAPLDVEVIFDQMYSVQMSDPTGERFNAAEAVLGTLNAGDRASVTSYGFVQGEFGYGEGSLQNTVTLAEPGSVDEALAQVSWLASDGGDYSMASDARYVERVLANERYRSEGPSNPYLDAGDTDPIDCRAHAILYITDGANAPAPDPEWEETPADYVPFVERTDIPVHILDVGVGTDSEWLVDLAADTGGTYSYVPTMTDLAQWVRQVTPIEVEDIDPAQVSTDTDGDGLSDWIEKNGYTAQGSRVVQSEFWTKRFFSDWQDPDTDGDGLTDGEEAGAVLQASELGGWTSGLPITVYHVRSDPTLVDSDADGLNDVAEWELGWNAFHGDADADGVDDSTELQGSSNPNVYDSDHDTYSDGFELDSRAEGFDPILENETYTTAEMANEFALGLLCGDVEVCRSATVPWVLGNILSGVLVFGDVRDAVWSIGEGNWLNFALIVAGFIPGLGDGLLAVAKLLKVAVNMAETGVRTIVSFILKFSRTSDEAVEILRLAHPGVVEKLEAHDVSATSIKKLFESNSPAKLNRMFDNGPNSQLQRFNYSQHPLPSFISIPGSRDWVQAQDWLKAAQGVPGYTQKRLTFSWNGTTHIRYPDAAEYSEVAGQARWGMMYEAKLGNLDMSPTLRQQIEADAAAVAGGRASGIEWHFFYSEATGKMGPVPSVVELLEEYGIPFYIHAP